MNHTYIERLCLALFLAISMAGCVQERVKDTDEGDLLQFTVSVVDPQSPRAASLRSLRATTTEDGNKYDPSLNENKITNMHLFLYDGETQVEYFSTTNGDLKIDNPEALTATVKARVNRVGDSTPLQGKVCELYVVANYPDTGETLKGKTLQELKKVVISTQQIADQKSTVTPHPQPQPQPFFLMDGHVRTDQMSWSGTKHVHKVPGTVELRRAAAKIRLMIDNIDLGSDFEMQGVSVALVNATAQTTLLDGTPAQTLGVTAFSRFSTGVRPEDFQKMEQRKFTLPGAAEKNYYVRPVPFYTYENDWSKNGDARTRLVVKLDVKVLSAGANQGTIKSFYYSVPVNYLLSNSNMTQEQKEGLDKVKRNHLYQIICNITKVGELDPGIPTPLDAAFSIENWDQDEVIDGNIAKAHYLVVKEKTPEMPNQSTRLIEFESDMPLDQSVFDQFRAEFSAYNYKGDEVKISGDKNYYYSGSLIEKRRYFENIKIKVVERDGKKYLEVTNPVPNNFVPWTIRFTAQQMLPQYELSAGAKPLYEDVVVTQYPPIYVTAEKSRGNTLYWYSPFGSYNSGGIDENGKPKAGHQTNGTLYKVHVLVPESGQIVGDPTGGDSRGRTGRDEELNKLISPEFVIASQWGMTNEGTHQYSSNSGGNAPKWQRDEIGRYTIWDAIGVNDDYWDGSRYNWRYKDYWDAESRCERYWEDKYGPSNTKEAHYDRHSSRTKSYNLPFVTIIGYWRIPSVAELQLIVKIQSNEHSAVKSLLWGRRYWAAKENTAVWFNNPKVDSWDWGKAFHRASYEGAPVRAIFDTYNK